MADQGHPSSSPTHKSLYLSYCENWIFNLNFKMLLWFSGLISLYRHIVTGILTEIAGSFLCFLKEDLAQCLVCPVASQFKVSPLRFSALPE